MYRPMFITGGNSCKQKVLRMCASQHSFPIDIMAAPKQTVIPRFTRREAREAGWELTSDPLWCPPDEGIVWICPDCSRRKAGGE